MKRSPHTPPAHPVLVTLAQLARMAQLAESTIRNRLAAYRRGEAPPVNFPQPIVVGARLRFRLVEVERWLIEGDGPRVAKVGAR